MKAIGYVKNICVDRDTGEVITKEEQKERILNYVKFNDVNLVEMYEDDGSECENIIDRPMIKKILNKVGDFDTLLVERVWCLTRRYKDLEMFLGELAKRGITVVSASTLWDCTSQKVRHYYYNRRKEERVYRKSA